MNSIKNIDNFYFIGIGGIGMSALARYFNLEGKIVFGYDKTPSEITSMLIQEGVTIQFKDEVSLIPELIQKNKKVLIVCTPAISKKNNILSWLNAKEYSITKRSELLGEISKNSICLAVAGTHGKTTTSAILGHLLASCNMPVTAFLGGVTENYNSNLIYKGTQNNGSNPPQFDKSLDTTPTISAYTINVGGSDTKKKLKVIR